MIRVLRDVATDLRPAAIMSLSLAFGLVVGVLVTIQLTDGTPYSRADLERAAALPDVQFPTPVRATTTPDDATELLEEQNASLRSRLRAAEARAGAPTNPATPTTGTAPATRPVPRLTPSALPTSPPPAGRAAEPTGGSAAEPTEEPESDPARPRRTPTADPAGVPAATPAPTPAPTSTPSSQPAPQPAPQPVPTGGAQPSTQPPTQPATPSPRGVAVTGSLETTWILTSRRRPWPGTCAAPMARYLVRVEDGSGTTVATVAPVSSVLTRRAVSRGTLSLSCRLTFRGTLTGPLAAGYRFHAVTVGARDAAQDSVTLSREQLSSGLGPDLRVSFCPECETPRLTR